MNEEMREENPEVTDAIADREADAADLVRELQDKLDDMEAELARKNIKVLELSQQSREPAGDEELRALAATVRTAQRNGHPDAAKHLDKLLGLLGA